MKKKIALLMAGGILFVNSTFATGDVNTGGTTPTPPSVQTEAQKATITCIKTAALTREGYLQGAYSTFTSAVMVSYLKRSNDIAVAYNTGKTMKEIRPLVRAAFETWKTSVKTARETLKKTRKDLRTTYKNDVKACKPDSAASQGATQDAGGQEKMEGGSL